MRSGAAVMRCRRALKLAAPAFARARGELPATGDLQSVTQRLRSDRWCMCDAAGCAQPDGVCDQLVSTARPGQSPSSLRHHLKRIGVQSELPAAGGNGG